MLASTSISRPYCVRLSVLRRLTSCSTTSVTLRSLNRLSLVVTLSMGVYAAVMFFLTALTPLILHQTWTETDKLAHTDTANMCNSLQYYSGKSKLSVGLVFIDAKSGFNESMVFNFLRSASCEESSWPQLQPVKSNFTVYACQTRATSHIGVLRSGKDDGYTVRSNWVREVVYWTQYSYAICASNDECCYWPSGGYAPNVVSVPSRNDNISVMNRQRVGVKTQQRVVLAFDLLDNFWHAANVLDSWCSLRHEDVSFAAIPSKDFKDDFQPYIYSWLDALGIQRDRLELLTDQTIHAQELILPQKTVSWFCLNDVLRPARDTIKDTIIVMQRKTVGLNRDIPAEITEELMRSISSIFRDKRVVPFFGNESFAHTQAMFSRAIAVLGPHGAAFVNVLFCHSDAVVIEYLTPEITRPWQMSGGQSVGLRWFPVFIQSFDSSEELLASVTILQAALEL